MQGRMRAGIILVGVLAVLAAALDGFTLLHLRPHGLPKVIERTDCSAEPHSTVAFDRQDPRADRMYRFIWRNVFLMDFGTKWKGVTHAVEPVCTIGVSGNEAYVLIGRDVFHVTFRNGRVATFRGYSHLK